MVNNIFPVSGSEPMTPRQLHEQFGEAVAKTETASTEWWNGVAAAANGISLQMSFEWIEGKGCPLQGFYNDEGEAGVRTRLLEEELLPHLQKTDDIAAGHLAEVLEVFKAYQGYAGIYDHVAYAADLRTAQSGLEKVIRGTPQLRERQLNDVSAWMDKQLPYFPQKDGFQFNH